MPGSRTKAPSTPRHLSGQPARVQLWAVQACLIALPIALFCHLQRVFVVTQRNHVLRSKDGGSTFEDITERFNSACVDVMLACQGAKLAPGAGAGRFGRDVKINMRTHTWSCVRRMA